MLNGKNFKYSIQRFAYALHTYNSSLFLKHTYLVVCVYVCVHNLYVSFDIQIGIYFENCL